MGSHADDEIRPANTIDNKKTAVVPSDREPRGALFYTFIIAPYPCNG
jgi:hypothetical protein